MLLSSGRALGLILFVGLVLRIVPIWFGLPYPMARPDEETAVGHALAVARGDLNPRFFHWPSLTFYVFGAIFAAVQALRSVWTADALSYPAVLLTARVVVALCGTASIYVVYRISRTFGDRAASLTASALFAVAILHVRESHFAMTDVLMTLLLLASLLALLRIASRTALFEEQSRAVVRGCAIAGVLAGLAASTKYNAAAVACAMAALQILWFVERPGRVRSFKAWRPAIAFAAAMVVAFVAATPFAVLDYSRFATDFAFNVHHLAEGHAGLDLGRGWGYHLLYSLPFGAGPTIFASAVLGIVAFAHRHGRAAWLLGAFGAAYFAAVGSGHTVFYRYILPLIPLLCLVAATGVLVAAEYVERTFRLPRDRAFALCLMIVVVPPLAQCIWFDAVLARNDSRALAAQWLAGRVQPGETVVDGGGPYVRLDVAVQGYRPFPLPAPADPESGPERPDWIVLYASPLTAYARMPLALRQTVTQGYELAYEVRATRPGARSATYDHQDAFFMPLNGFHRVVRPGPTIRIYRRR